MHRCFCENYAPAGPLLPGRRTNRSTHMRTSYSMNSQEATFERRKIARIEGSHTRRGHQQRLTATHSDSRRLIASHGGVYRASTMVAAPHDRVTRTYHRWAPTAFPFPFLSYQRIVISARLDSRSQGVDARRAGGPIRTGGQPPDRLGTQVMGPCR